MSGLYNMMFGWNPACVLLAPMLTDENPQYFFPRFRDCYLSEDKDHIEIYTRVGGGNRDDYAVEIEGLRSMPTYVSDEDDGFDCTYATFTFGVPDEWEADFERVTAGRLDELSDAYVERIAKCYEADAGKLKESLAAAKMDAKVLGNAPDWHGFFDALRGEGEGE